jgi:hypothetical protein
MRARGVTIVGLVAGAVGIVLLWVGGVAFPFYPPPGVLILAAGAVFVALAPWAWVPAVGALVGVFMIVGFVASSLRSGAGTGYLMGDAGVAGSVGTVVQMVGVVTALVAGVLATRRELRAARGGG